MLKAAAFFAVIALISALFGFGGIAGFAWGIAKFLFWISVIIAVILLVLGLTIYKKLT